MEIGKDGYVTFNQGVVGSSPTGLAKENIVRPEDSLFTASTPPARKRKVSPMCPVRNVTHVSGRSSMICWCEPTRNAVTRGPSLDPMSCTPGSRNHIDPWRDGRVAEGGSLKTS